MMSDWLADIKADLGTISQWPWAVGKGYGSVINPKGRTFSSFGAAYYESSTEAYGGELIGESFDARNSRFVARAPELIAELVEIVERLERQLEDARNKIDRIDEVIHRRDADGTATLPGVPSNDRN